MSEDPVDRKNEVKQGKLISQSILLDITNYQEIYSELRKQAESTKLPLSHVIFNLLSLGIMTVREEEKRRRSENSDKIKAIPKTHLTAGKDY